MVFGPFGQGVHGGGREGGGRGAVDGQTSGENSEAAGQRCQRRRGRYIENCADIYIFVPSRKEIKQILILCSLQVLDFEKEKSEKRDLVRYEAKYLLPWVWSR